MTEKTFDLKRFCGEKVEIHFREKAKVRGTRRDTLSNSVTAFIFEYNGGVYYRMGNQKAFHKKHIEDLNIRKVKVL